MRNGCLAALTVLLAGHGVAFAQPSPDPAGFWGSAEYLFGWTRSGRIPPLVTTGGDRGAIGEPGARVLVDDLDFDDRFRPGGRFALGYRFETIPGTGVEARYFFLSDRQSGTGFSSSPGGDPILAQPFTDAVTGLPTSQRVTFPGVTAGTVVVTARTALWGAEANLTTEVVRSDRFRLAALGGFRFLSLEDEVASGERFRAFPGVPGFGGRTATLVDEFRTANRFYGGQLGLEAGVRRGLLTLDFRGVLALGGMRQTARIDGVTEVAGPDGSRTFFPGGLYALRSNVGRYQRDELAFIPEVNLNVGVQLTRHAKLSAGYSFLWVSTVARAGDQIDPVVNVSQFPIVSGDGPLVGPARPAFRFDGTDFWAQALSLGLELRY